jgi:TonB family protein
MNIAPTPLPENNVTEIEILSSGTGNSNTANQLADNSHLSESVAAASATAIEANPVSNTSAVIDETDVIVAKNQPVAASKKTSKVAPIKPITKVASAKNAVPMQKDISEDLDSTLNHIADESATDKNRLSHSGENNSAEIENLQKSILADDNGDLAVLTAAQKQAASEKKLAEQAKQKRLQSEAQAQAAKDAQLAQQKAALLAQQQQEALQQQSDMDSQFAEAEQQAQAEKQAQAAAAAAAAKQAQMSAATSGGRAKTKVAGDVEGDGLGNSDSPRGSTGHVRKMEDLRQLPGNLLPAYSDEDRFYQRSGEVVFEAYVTPKGTTTNFRMIQSSGHRSLDLKSLKAFKSWKFFPGQEGTVEMAYNWSLKGEAKERPALLRRH